MELVLLFDKCGTFVHELGPMLLLLLLLEVGNSCRSGCAHFDWN